MTLGRKILIGGLIAGIIIAKIYFALSGKHALYLLSIPAALLIITEPAEAGTGSYR